MARRKDTDVVNLRLRLPEALRKQLDVAAEKSDRSLNSEILWRLGQTFGKEWMEFVGEMERQERNDQEFLERFMNNPEARAKLQKIIADYVAKHPEIKPPEKKDR
jgi:Arc-like DNA binding domain